MKQLKCIRPLGHLTKDRIYTVVGKPDEKSPWVAIVDDQGQVATYDIARFEILHTPKGSPTFAEMQQIADSVKITCPQTDSAKAAVNPDAIACPVVESVNDLLMKNPLKQAHETIAQLKQENERLEKRIEELLEKVPSEL